jgi:hypothetical protein
MQKGAGSAGRRAAMRHTTAEETCTFFDRRDAFHGLTARASHHGKACFSMLQRAASKVSDFFDSPLGKMLY